MLKRLLALTALLLLVPAAQALAADRPVQNMRYAIDSSPNFDQLSRTGQRHGMVVLQAWRLDEMRAIKAANPNVKVLVYKNLSFATQGTGPGGLSSSGVHYSQAEAQPEWFLKNTSGQRFTSQGYSFLWAMDVGSRSYQEKWADNVVSEVDRNGWDGVFLDDANPTMKYHYNVSSVAKYPSDSAYTAAATSALAHIGPRIQAAGKLAIPNNAQWVEYYDVGVNWLQYVSGQMDEMFLKWSSNRGEGYREEGQWKTQLNEIKTAERMNKIFVGVTHSSNDDRKAALFGYATSLLAGNGRTQFAFHGDYTNEPWFPEYDLDIGAPTDAEREDLSRVHRRPFTRGMVLVNPTSSTKVASLPATYTAPGLGGVTEVTLAPSSGVVLQKVPPPPTTEPPTTEPPTTEPPTTEPPTTEPRPRKHPQQGSVLAAVNETGKVALGWPRAGLAESIRYKVYRGARKVHESATPGFVDPVPSSAVHTYQVKALNARGEIIRVARVSVPVPDASASVRSERGGTARAYFSAPDISLWDHLYVQRRGRSSGDWRRASIVKRPRTENSFRLELPASAEIRMVVRRAGRTTRPLSSPAVPLAGH